MQFDKPYTSGPELSKPFIIAEAGIHHYNNLDLAHEYVKQASIAGADAIKFQSYTADELCTKESEQYETFQKTQSLFDREEWQALFHFGASYNVAVLSTPFSLLAAQELRDLGMPIFKIASGDITNLPLIEEAASYGKRMLISTGGSTVNEIQRAFEAGMKSGHLPIMMHCSLAYPTETLDANLGRIKELIYTKGVTVGYSDHTTTPLACPLAIAMGATVIEKHFTLNKLLPGDDHGHAVDAQGLARLVRDCRDAYEMVKFKGFVTDAEKPGRLLARRSIVAARDLKAGVVLAEADLAYKRPGRGIPPTSYSKVVGRELKKDVERDELIRYEYL